jgi:hypothetical protein
VLTATVSLAKIYHRNISQFVMSAVTAQQIAIDNQREPRHLIQTDNNSNNNKQQQPNQKQHHQQQ